MHVVVFVYNWSENGYRHPIALNKSNSPISRLIK